MGLADRFRFPGEAGNRELQEQYRDCSLVVVPSLVPESFGMVGVEAMAFAKPIVAYDAGGVTEWLADGVNGFVVRRGDVSELADRVHRLIEDPVTSARFGAEGRRRQQTRFTLDRHLDSITPIYEDSIASRVGAAK
jgi:glycosyltransferase involved in cell wall biosynthesis